MNREEMVAKLEGGYCTVVFTKVNGDERTMRCTLQKSVLPKASKEDPNWHLSEKKMRDLNEETLVVWDGDVDGWRSFRVENVTSFLT